MSSTSFLSTVPTIHQTGLIADEQSLPWEHTEKYLMLENSDSATLTKFSSPLSMRYCLTSSSFSCGLETSDLVATIANGTSETTPGPMFLIVAYMLWKHSKTSWGVSLLSSLVKLMGSNVNMIPFV